MDYLFYMKILTAVVNNPGFIRIQFHTFQKYVKGDYEFIVFNDAKDFPDYSNDNDVSIKTQIEETCKELGIICINIPNEHHKDIDSACRRCADSMNYMLQYQKENPDKYLVIDSDMFLIADMDIDRWSQYECAIVLQSRNNNVHYFWNGLSYMDMTKMPNTDLLNWTPILDGVFEEWCDVGGSMKEWLKQKHPVPNADDIRWKKESFHSDSVYYIKHLWSCSWNMDEMPQHVSPELISFIQNDSRNQNGKYFCEIYDDIFLHYRAGGNWMKEGMALHKELTNKLRIVLTSTEK
jgi:hypothetical protein